MNDLIERIETASGPDRELDAEIFRAIGSPLPTQFGPLGIALEWDDDGISATVPIGDMQVRFTPPAFTASIDAALTLKPSGEGHWPQLIMTGTNPNNPSRQRERAEIWTKNGGKPFRGHSATPALALCAAAMKARAYLKETNNAD